MLGANDYGAFAAILALAALLSPFSSLGTNTLMVRNVARDPLISSFEWKRALLFTICGGVTSSLLLAAMAHWIAPPGVSWAGVFCIVFADLVGLRMIDLVGSFWQARGRIRDLALLPSVVNLLRLISAIAAWFTVGAVALETWAWIYAAATVPLGLVVAFITTTRVGLYRARTPISTRDLREGLLFSTALAAQNVYNDIDKAMLGRLVSATSAGIYSAAYRIIDMAYAPIRSVAAATYPLFFKEGKDGLTAALKITRRILWVVLGYAIVGSVGVYLAAPLCPLILGDDYVEAVQFIQWMSALIVLRALSFLAADTLTGSGHQTYRTSVQVGMAVANVAMNFYLLPLYGVGGAVISTLVCEALLGMFLWLYIAAQLRTQRIAEREKARKGKRGRRKATARDS